MTTRTKTTRLAVAQVAFGLGACALLCAGTADATNGRNTNSLRRRPQGYEPSTPGLRESAGQHHEWQKQGRSYQDTSLRRHSDGQDPHGGYSRDHKNPFSRDFEAGKRKNSDLRGTLRQLRSRWSGWNNKFRKAKNSVFAKVAKGALLAQIVAMQMRNKGLEIATTRRTTARFGAKQTAFIRTSNQSIGRLRGQNPIQPKRRHSQARTKLAVLGQYLRAGVGVLGSTSPAQAARVAFGAVRHPKATFAAITKSFGAPKNGNTPSDRASDAGLREQRGEELRHMVLALHGLAPEPHKIASDIRLLSKTEM